ncbi:protein of unknown function [Beijerinckiaceae bacterium RH AL1]|nr:protein of unknown function [Beijerinckiaceae bacterium RH AL8]VVB42568.1 protein of unknown function [Beijerinckiaceae bacterium RH CH11]VVC53380.1 protein of unknown function [Beijerinckiaceae bacterium RH AL1]
MTWRDRLIEFATKHLTLVGVTLMLIVAAIIGSTVR